VLTILGNNVPFAVFAPYVPFEFVIGVWILIKGVKVDTETNQQLAYADATK
jgi:hypothetical protein